MKMKKSKPVNFSEEHFTKYTSLSKVQEEVIAKKQGAKSESDENKFEEIVAWITGAADFITIIAKEAEEVIHEYHNQGDDLDKNKDDSGAFKQKLEDLCGNKFTDAFKCTRSVIVYFVPGRKPMAAFIEWDRDKQQEILNRVNELDTLLNRQQFNVTKRKFNHLFEFSHAIFQDAIKDSKPRSFLIPEIVPKGASRNRIVHELTKYRWELDESLKEKFKDEMLLVTGVVTTKDSLVIQATYYNKDFLKSLFNNVNLKRYDKVLLFSAMRHLHEMFAREVLSRFYAPLIQFNAKTLRIALQRTNVSKSFLEQAGRRLVNDDENNFTYSFKHKEEPRCCADLYEIIFCDMVDKMDTIFETIIKVEEEMYYDLQARLEENQNTLKQNKDYALWQFPERLEMTKLV
jgi:hypothetical protein